MAEHPASAHAVQSDHYSQCLECLASLYLQLLCAADPASLLPELVRQVQKVSGAQHCLYIRRMDSHGPDWLAVKAEAETRIGTAFEETWAIYDFAQRGLRRWEEELCAGREIACPVGELPSEEQASPDVAGLSYVLALPVKRGHDVMGCLILGYNGSGRHPSPQELHLLQGLPAAIGAALERHLTETLLGDAHIELSNILRSSTEYVIIATDASFRVTRTNPLGEALLTSVLHGGLNASLAEPRVLVRLGVDLGEVRDTVAAGDTWEAEHEVRIPGGNLLAHTVVSGMRNARNELCGYLVLARDITEQRQEEKRMLERQRMQSIGLLAGGVAHDFNNILMGILGYASLAKDRLETGHAAYRMLGTIEQSAERAADLTRALLAYARGGKNETLPVLLDVMAEELLDILRTNLPKGITINKRFSERLPYVLADPAQIQQVVMNLCLNAGEAILEKKSTPAYSEMTGEISLRTGVQVLDAPACVQLGISEEMAGREFTYLEVTDNGCGMDAATIARIFEPFFTTKFAGRGLGLAAVEGIVRNHGGSLQVRSAPGIGTTFTLYLPAAGYMAPVEEEAGDLKVGQGETVLVIDDEEVVGQLALLTLTNLGYQVMLAHDGASGLSALREHIGEIDALLLDITLPGPGGAALLARFLELKPELPVLLTSGFDETVAAGLIGEGQAAGFIRKPYTPETLARAIRSILDEAAGA